MEVYHHQKAFHEKQGRWAQSLEQLGLGQSKAGQLAEPRLMAADGRFRATLEIPIGDKTEAWSIRHDSRLRRVRPEDELGDTLDAILSRQADAWNRGDLEAFMEHYWKSDDLTFSSGGHVARGWKTTKENYQRRYPTRERMGNLAFGAVEVTALGDAAALVLGRWNLQRDPAPVGGNFSLMFRRIDGTWVIVHDHTSRDPEPVELPGTVKK